MSWPTSEQFDAASTLGTEYALQEHAGGATEPQESPLSGEWADGITERDVVRNVGFDYDNEDEDTGEGITELGNAWETAYNDQWRVQTSV